MEMQIPQLPPEGNTVNACTDAMKDSVEECNIGIVSQPSRDRSIQTRPSANVRV